MRLLTLVWILVSSPVHAQYFVVSAPSASTLWANGSPYPFSWSKSRDDGITSFDVKLTRLKEDGLYLVARNVPATYTTLNILLQDVPESNDYYLICLNSTKTYIYAVSSPFTVTNASAARNPSPDPSVPTVTISGAPNPLLPFATTLGPLPNGGNSLHVSPNPTALGFGGILALCAVFLGGVMTLC